MLTEEQKNELVAQLEDIISSTVALQSAVLDDILERQGKTVRDKVHIKRVRERIRELKHGFEEAHLQLCLFARINA